MLYRFQYRNQDSVVSLECTVLKKMINNNFSESLIDSTVAMGYITPGD